MVHPSFDRDVAFPQTVRRNEVSFFTTSVLTSCGLHILHVAMLVILHSPASISSSVWSGCDLAMRVPKNTALVCRSRAVGPACG